MTARLLAMKGRRVEGIGLGLLLPEAELGPHPLIIGGETLLRDEDVVGFLQILEFVEALARMSEQNLRLLLERRGDDEGRDVLLHGREGLHHVAAHVEVDAAHGEQHAVVGLRPARHDLDLEAAAAIGAVGQSLIIAAVLGLGDPVRAEPDLGRRGRLGARRSRQGTERHGCRERLLPLRHGLPPLPIV
jgi:hypothetical protein